MEQNRNFVYVFKSVHNTTIAINYSGRSDVNTFLSYFDVWGGRGHQQLCSDENHSKFVFECSKEFYDFCHTEDFQRVFRVKMNVELVDDFSYVAKID